MDVLEAIKTRRTVRFFKPKPLSDEQIRTILDAGRLAPSGKNRQPWEFIVIKNKETRQKICELFLQYFCNFCESLPENDPLRVRVQSKLNSIRRFYRNAPIFIAILGNRTIETYMQDVSAAIENMTLAAWGLSIGTAWLYMLPERETCHLLGIPKKFKLIVCMPFGHPEEAPSPPPRKRLEKITHYERYGQKNPSDAP